MTLSETGQPARPAPLDPATLALSRFTVARAGERRTDAAWLEAARRSAGTRVLVMGKGAVYATGTADAPRLVLVAPDEVPDGGEWYLLGEDPDGTAYFAVVLDELPEPGPDEAAVVRLITSGDSLDPHDAGLLVHTTALANWHATHRRCSRCGEPTEVTAAGHVRHCPACGADHFPRTDPAMIVLVHDDDGRALLGRQAVWPEGRYSVLAGFVEPGESLESAVVREVQEEAAVPVDAVTYVGSQPWPFPSSLMFGCVAHAPATTPRADGEELTDVRWFTRDEVADGITAGTLKLPPPVSIARQLIEQWYGGPLPGSKGW